MGVFFRTASVAVAAALVLSACESPDNRFVLDSSSVTRSVSAAAGGLVELGRAHIDIPPGCLAADADVSIVRADGGPTGGQKFEFSTGGVGFCPGRVWIQMPLETEGDRRVVAAAFAASGGRWEGVPAEHGDGVVRAQVDHLSDWSPIDVFDALADFVGRRLASLAKTFGLRAHPPKCGGNPAAPRTKVSGSALERTDPALYTCTFVGSDRALWMQVVNNRTYGVRIKLPDGVAARRRSTDGTVAEHALKAFRVTSAGVYVPPGGSVHLRTGRRGRALALRVTADIPTSVVSLVADVVEPLLGPAGNVAVGATALADCVRARGADLSEGTPANLGRIAVDCLVAATKAVDRRGDGKVSIPTVARKVLRFAARVAGQAAMALDASPVLDLLADRLRFGKRGVLALARPPMPKPKPKPRPESIPVPESILETGGVIVIPDSWAADACCDCGCHHHG